MTEPKFDDVMVMVRRKAGVGALEGYNVHPSKIQTGVILGCEGDEVHELLIALEQPDADGVFRGLCFLQAVPSLEKPVSVSEVKTYHFIQVALIEGEVTLQQRLELPDENKQEESK
jgi:hypothetical protein